MFKDKIKELFNDDGDDKRKIENLVVFIVLIIITILIINMVWGNNSEKEITESANVKLAENKSDLSSNKIETGEYNLEQNLENILSKISGAGNVKVLITYSESSQIVPVQNENYKETSTEENDKTGGIRNIEEIDKKVEVIYSESNGQKNIITQKIIMPKIEGALILASGAGNMSVKTNIIQAVEALTGLATHKIQVLQMENKD